MLDSFGRGRNVGRFVATHALERRAENLRAQRARLLLRDFADTRNGIQHPGNKVKPGGQVK